MAPDPGHEAHDDTIQHQTAVEAVAAEVATGVATDLIDGVEYNNDAIDDPTAVEPEASVTREIFNELRGTVVDILDALRNSGIIPSA